MKEKSEVSRVSPFYISGFRYLELKNFCRQYPTWIKAKAALRSRAASSQTLLGKGVQNPDGTNVEKVVEAIENFNRLIDIIHKSLSACKYELQIYILESVTEGISYDTLAARFGVLPSSRQDFYRERRKFFYILNRIRR